MSKNQRIDFLKRKQNDAEKKFIESERKKFRRNDSLSSKHYYRPASTIDRQQISSHEPRTFPRRNFARSFTTVNLKPVRRRSPPRYPIRKSRGSLLNNREAKDAHIYGKARFFPPTYDISPDRSSVKTPEVLNPNDLKEMMIKAKENENLDEYYRCRDLLNDLLNIPPEPIGKSKHHKPDYQLFPIRTRCKTPEKLDVIELRKLMKNAKENKNLDAYYHYRDLLNNLRKNPKKILENNLEEAELVELDCVGNAITNYYKKFYLEEIVENDISNDTKESEKPFKTENINKAMNDTKNKTKTCNRDPHGSGSEEEDEEDFFLQFQEEGLDMDEMTKAANSEMFAKQSTSKDDELDLRETLEGFVLSQEKESKIFRRFLLLFIQAFERSQIIKQNWKNDEISYFKTMLKLKDENFNGREPLSLIQMSFIKFIELLY